MRLTSKCQVTVPKHIREKLGVGPGSNVEFVEKSGEVVLVKESELGTARERRMQEFRRWLEKVRGTGDSGMSADEILEMTRGPFDDVEPR